MLKRVYGFSLEELATAPRNILEIFFKELPRVLASEQMMMIQSVSVPHMEENDRKTIINELKTQMEAGRSAEQVVEKVSSHTQMHALSADAGFGFVIEDA